MAQVSVFGAGAWGTALACALATRQATRLWARDPAQADALVASRMNARYLPGVELPPGLGITADWKTAIEHLQGREALAVLAVPVSGLRAVLARLVADAPQVPRVWLCKGFELDTHRLAHEIAAELGDVAPSGPLSGPSFAQEVALGLPTALTVAGTADFCAHVTRIVHGGALRVYASDDPVGVEVGGAVKNVMAIATGVSDALGLGANARAALMTRGLAETARLGVALGARAETFMGLTGLGDLILTCTGDLSRNRRVGLLLGAGRSLDEALGTLGHVAEGVWSAPAIAARAHALGVEMPLTFATCEVLAGRLAPAAALERLLARDPRNEVESPRSEG